MSDGPHVLVLAREGISAVLASFASAGVDNVEVVSDGLAALDRVASRDVDFIVVHLGPADLASLATVARIRDLKRGKTLRMILATPGTSADRDRLAAMARPLNVERVVAWPLDAAALIGASTPHAEPDALSALETRLASADLLERLGVEAQVSDDGVRKRFFELADKLNQLRAFHQQTDGARLDAMYATLMEAFRLLRDPVRRAEYVARTRSLTAEPPPIVVRQTAATPTPAPLPTPTPEPPPEREATQPKEGSEASQEHRAAVTIAGVDANVLAEAATACEVLGDHPGVVTLLRAAMQAGLASPAVECRVLWHEAQVARRHGDESEARRLEAAATALSAAEVARQRARRRPRRLADAIEAMRGSK